MDKDEGFMRKETHKLDKHLVGMSLHDLQMNFDIVDHGILLMKLVDQNIVYCWKVCIY